LVAAVSAVVLLSEVVLRIAEEVGVEVVLRIAEAGAELERLLRTAEEAGAEVESIAEEVGVVVVVAVEEQYPDAQ